MISCDFIKQVVVATSLGPFTNNLSDETLLIRMRHLLIPVRLTWILHHEKEIYRIKDR